MTNPFKLLLLTLLVSFSMGNLCHAQELGDKDLAFKSTYASDFKPGAQGIIEFGYGVGDGVLGRNNIRMNAIYSYRFTPYFSMGLGTGLRYQVHGRVVNMPVFADFRANLTSQKVSPYFAFGIGSTFDLSSNFNRIGFLFSPSAGLSFPVSQKHKMNIGIGYEIQQQAGYYGNFYVDPSNGMQMAGGSSNGASMSLNIGFKF